MSPLLLRFFAFSFIFTLAVPFSCGYGSHLTYFITPCACHSTLKVGPGLILFGPYLTCVAVPSWRELEFCPPLVVHRLCDSTMLTVNLVSISSSLYLLTMPSCSNRGLTFLVHRRTRLAASKEVLTWSFVSCSILLGLQCIRNHRSVDLNMALVELSGGGRQFCTSYLVNTCIPFFHTSANVSTLLWP